MIRTPTINVAEWIDQQNVGAFQLRVLVLCAAAVMLDGFDIQSIGYVAPAIARDLHLGPSALSSVFAAGLAGLTLGALFFGPAADRMGRRSMIINCTLFFGLISFATATAHSAATLMAFRFIGGLALGGVMPNAIALTSEFCPHRRHGTIVMVMCCGFPLGATVGGFAAAPIIPAFGWRGVFVLGGLLPTFLAPLLIFMLPESIRYLVVRGARADRIIPILRSVSPRSVFPADATFVLTEEHSSGIPIFHLFRENRALPTLLMWVVFFVSLLDLFLLSNWLPTVFHDSGISLSVSVIATALFSGGGVLGAIMLGRIIDRAGPYRVLSIAYFVAAIFVALLGHSHSILSIMICTFVAGIVIIGGQIGANVLAASFYPTFIRSTGVGWALGIGRLGSIIGPVLGGLMLSLHWPLTTIFFCAALPVLAGCMSIYLMGNTKGARDAAHRVDSGFARTPQEQHAALAAPPTS